MSASSDTHGTHDEEDRPIPEHELDTLAKRIPGAKGNSPLALPRAAWWSIAKRIYVMIGFHNISLLAAGSSRPRCSAFSKSSFLAL